jgi:putative ABC transport system permease protein
MNLSTSRSAGRSKEVGVRKVLGSRRANLILQFLIESMLTSFIALLVAIIMATLLLPYLNQLSGKEIRLNLLSVSWLLPSLLLGVIAVGVLAGSYPAFYLSAFKPVQVLKGKLATGFKGSWLRNGLVVFQFTTAIVLIIGTLIIYSQLNYIQNKKLGYDREQVIVLQNTASLWIHAKTFKNEVLQLPGIVAGTMTGVLPTSSDWNTNAFCKDATLNASQTIGLGIWPVDADFIPTLGIQMAEGRNFSAQMPTDSAAIIINETAARLIGYKDPLNKHLYQGDGRTTAAFRIIGVVKDFNAGSLRHKIPPLAFRLSEQRNSIAFRIKTKNMPALIAQVEGKYHSIEKMSGQPFLYSFMDDDFNKLYQSEQHTGQLFIYFSFFAILIACLGLFGLVTYAAEQRTREIGIRKVLGASVIGIVSLLSKDFLKLVFIAVIIATPIAWLLMNKWLRDFAYRIDISWQVFVLAALLATIIAIITVGFQAIKAALVNPVKSLKTE